MKFSMADLNRLIMAYTPYTLGEYHPACAEQVLLNKLHVMRDRVKEETNELEADEN